HQFAFDDSMLANRGFDFAAASDFDHDWSIRDRVIGEVAVNAAWTGELDFVGQPEVDHHAVAAAEQLFCVEPHGGGVTARGDQSLNDLRLRNLTNQARHPARVIDGHGGERRIGGNRFVAEQSQRAGQVAWPLCNGRTRKSPGESVGTFAVREEQTGGLTQATAQIRKVMNQFNTITALNRPEMIVIEASVKKTEPRRQQSRTAQLAPVGMIQLPIIPRADGFDEGVFGLNIGGNGDYVVNPGFNFRPEVRGIVLRMAANGIAE